MVYKTKVKRSYRRKYKRMASKWYNKKYSVGEIASKALTGVKYLKTLVNSEMKIKDTTVTAQNIDWNGLVFRLTDLNIGDLNYERNGNSVLLNYCNVRSMMNLDSFLGTPFASVRMIVFRDKQVTSTGAPPVANDIIQQIGSVNAVNQFYDTNFLGRFEVLFDKQTELTSVNKTQVQCNSYNKINKHVRWEINSGTPRQGHMYVMYISNTDALNPVKLNMNSRIYYRDN